MGSKSILFWEAKLTQMPNFLEGCSESAARRLWAVEHHLNPMLPKLPAYKRCSKVSECRSGSFADLFKDQSILICHIDANVSIFFLWFETIIKSVESFLFEKQGLWVHLTQCNQSFFAQTLSNLGLLDFWATENSYILGWKSLHAYFNMFEAKTGNLNSNHNEQT
jgi:hypothetical protein